jgi:hypothetical protein
MEKISVNEQERPSTRKVKVSDCQLCGGTMNNYIMSVQRQANTNIEKFMETNPEDPRIPLLKTMIDMDKQFQAKLHPIVKIKTDMDNLIQELTKKYADTVVLTGYENPRDSKLNFHFSPEKFKQYSDELKVEQEIFNKKLEEFTESEMDITPMYCEKLPHFKLFPDDPNLRNPLKGFILPLD